MPALDFEYSPWLIVPAAIIAAGASWFLYRKLKDVLPTWANYLLAGFRWLVLTLIFFLLLGPLLNSISKVYYPPIVAVLQDDTESIVIQKDSNFVRDEYPALLNQFLGKFDGENEVAQLYSFSNQLEQVDSPDSLTFEQTGTNLSGSLEELQKLYRNQNLGAVVMISDGISTSGANPLYSLEGLKLPVYTVMLGDTSEQKDMRITEVLYNDIAYLENETPIRVKLRSEGFETKKVTVRLSQGGKTLASQEVQLGGNQSEAEVDFLVEPKQVGIQQYGIHITEFPEELTRRNNHKLIFVNVLETRVKVALFAGSPHPDLGALHKAFARDDRYELIDFIHEDRQGYYESPDKYDFADFDLVILHNFPFSNSDKDVVDKIVNEVKGRNLPLMAFFGIFTDLRTADPLYEYLGITPKVIAQGQEEAQFNFSVDYMEHSTYTFDRDWIRLMNQAPPMLRNRSEWKAKPDAKVFSTSTIKNIQLEYPLFGLQQHLNRKNMVFVGENFWRVRSHVFVETDDFDAFDTWLHNTVQWLVVKEDKRKFKVRPSKQLFTGNEPITFKGQVYDDSYNPVQGAEIKLTVTDPRGTEDVYYLSESGEARYFLEMNNLGEGTYSYVAEGKRGDVQLGTDRGQFSVGKSNIEHFQTRANDDLLQQMALRTEGQYIQARDLPALADQIKNLNHFLPTTDTRKNRKGFHELPWVFFLLLFLLTVEWVLRKRFSLV